MRFTIEDETTFSGRLFHNGIILLEKLYLRVSYRIRLIKNVLVNSYHNSFAHACQLTNQLSHYHIRY